MLLQIFAQVNAILRNVVGKPFRKVFGKTRVTKKQEEVIG